jgi:hypothetical protein
LGGGREEEETGINKGGKADQLVKEGKPSSQCVQGLR